MLDELIDRFGDLPRPVQNLLLVSQLREEAHSLYLTEIREKQTASSLPCLSGRS